MQPNIYKHSRGGSRQKRLLIDQFNAALDELRQFLAF